MSSDIANTAIPHQIPVMTDDQRGDIEVATDLYNQIEQLAGLQWIERSGGFVGQQ